MNNFINSPIQGDGLQIMPQILDKSIDMILCDLPYGKTACKWDVIIPFELLWIQYKRIIKDDGAIVLTAIESFASYLRMSNIKWYKYDWIWEKGNATGHLNAKKIPMKAHENILIFYKKFPTYNPQKTKGYIRKILKAERFRLQSECYRKQKGITIYDSTERYPRSVIKISSDKQKSKLHPTQKPVALFEYLIKTYTNENDLVLDNCAGSFTTAIACNNLNRNWICIEKEEKYCEMGRKRIQQNKEQKTQKELT